VTIRFHPHVLERFPERGASQSEVIETIHSGERFEAKFGRVGFRKTFSFDSTWRRRFFHSKEIVAFAIPEGED
jgi:hypothetical protein